MAKRQTTGMPKKGRRGKSEEVESQGWLDDLMGNPRTRGEREAAVNQLVIRISVGIVVVIGVLIAFALAWEFLVVPNRSVATVNGENITVREFRQRVNFERAYVAQQANARYSQLEQQAAQFGMDVNQFVQNDQQLQQWSREISVTDVLGQRVLNDMIDDLLIEQAAEERGIDTTIEVDSDVYDQQVQDFFGYDPTEVAAIGLDPTTTPTPTITPTPFVSPTPTNTPLPTAVPTDIPETTPEVDAEANADVDPTEVVPATIAPSPTPSQDERRENFETSIDLFRENIREQAEVGNSVIDEFFQRQAIQDALMEELFGAETATYVNARHILVETEDEANAILTALDNGAPFSELARANSTDGSASNGGELGWGAATGYVAEFRDAVLDAEIGTIVGPVETQFGFHIIQVRAREERDIEGQELERIKRQQFAAWMEDYREANEDNITTNDNWPNFLN